MSLKIDTSDITKGIERILRDNRVNANKALGLVGKEMIDDAVNQDPKVPVDTGRLKSSGFSKVENNELVVGFDTPYAGKVHELSKSGKKYLSSKVERNRAEYKKVLERELSDSPS